MVQKEIHKKDVGKSVKKAKEEILEAEESIDDAHEDVIGVAKNLKGEKKDKFIHAAKDLEKANYSAGESCEATEEAEEEIREIK